MAYSFRATHTACNTSEFNSRSTLNHLKKIVLTFKGAVILSFFKGCLLRAPACRYSGEQENVADKSLFLETYRL